MARIAQIATGAWFYCHVAVTEEKTQRPQNKQYPQELKTLGDHIRKDVLT